MYIGLYHKLVFVTYQVFKMTTLDDVHYLASNFKRMQGLNLVPLGLFFIVEGLGHFTWTPWGNVGGNMLMNGYFALFCFTLFALYGCIRLYYEMSFGDAVPKRQKWTQRLLDVALLILVIALGGLFDHFFPRPIMTGYLFLGIYVIIRFRKDSRRLLQIVLGSFIIIFSILPMLGEHWQVLPYFTATLGIVLIGMGFYYHFRLMQLFKSLSRQVES